jgi:hypothetical protein
MRESCEARSRIPLPHAIPDRIVAYRMTLDAVLIVAIIYTTALNIIARISPSGNIVNNLLTILVEGPASLERHGMTTLDSLRPRIRD